MLAGVSAATGAALPASAAKWSRTSLSSGTPLKMALPYLLQQVRTRLPWSFRPATSSPALYPRVSRSLRWGRALPSLQANAATICARSMATSSIGSAVAKQRLSGASAAILDM